MSINEINTKQTKWLEPKLENIPEALKGQPWAVWKAEPRLNEDGSPSGKFNKAPLNPLTGIKVGANKPELFGTFDDAKNAYKTGRYTGIGVLLTGNGVTGVDIDDAVNLFDKRPEVKKWVKDAINAGVYCEESPSQTGVRLFLMGALHGRGKKSGGLEIYDNGRFLTVTGHVIPKKECAA
jgi:primase-polymerase (primpol)-like protein